MAVAGLRPQASGLRRFAPYAPTIVLAVAAVAIAWCFVATTLAHTERMGFPLDDSYIYLNYAKQAGRGHPFTYFTGGGYSAGTTSPLWPLVLAPLWTLGARGHALVWAAFALCTALYGATAIAGYRFVRALAGEIVGVIAGALVLVVAPFAWGALSGMEVAFASALAVAAVLLVARAPSTGPPPKLLAVCLAALALARPEALPIVIAACATGAVQRARTRELGAAAWWLAPLAAPALWLVVNRALIGHFAPNTAVAKSYFDQPGFDLGYWSHTVFAQLGALARGLFWDSRSPFALPPVVALGFVAGAVRISLWAQREQRYFAGTVAIFAPIAILGAVIATSGQWDFQNHRYIAPALPLIMIVAACALAPPARLDARMRRVWLAGAGAVAAVWIALSLPRLAADMRFYAQGVMDTNSQVVRLGEYIHERVPGQTVALHDAGAIAYYGDGPVLDLAGLVTNGVADVWNHGPGARFEYLESLPPEARPAYFAYYPGWMGQSELFGDVLVHTTVLYPFETRRLVGGSDMELIAASWDHVGTGERPLNDHTGWAIVDRIDIADLASERAHGWHGGLGRRHFGERAEAWSLVEREVLAQGLVIDGGRTIRDGRERFTITLDPARPARVVVRTGGQSAYPPYHEAITKPITLRLYGEGKQLGELVVAPPVGVFAELTFALPMHSLHARQVELSTEATGAYRSFHWFVLQPD